MDCHSDQNPGLVFSCAGAYGAYEVGVLKALAEGVSWDPGLKPGDFSTIVGALGGALNAALFVSHCDANSPQWVQRLENVWLDRIAKGPDGYGNGLYRLRGAPEILDQRAWANPVNLASDMYSDGVFFLRRALKRGREILSSTPPFKVLLIESADLSALFNPDRFADLLDEVISFESIGSSDIDLWIIATDLDEGKRRRFDNHDVFRFREKSILAAAAIPGIFSPVEIGNHLFAAEGTLINTPILPTSGRALHVIYRDPKISEAPSKMMDTTIGALDLLFTINWATAMNREIDEIGERNKGLALVQETDGAIGDQDRMSRARERVRDILATDESRQGPTTIHRYHPREDMGALLGFLDFSRDHLERLIEQGYRDAKNHDCAQSGCLLPPVSRD